MCPVRSGLDRGNPAKSSHLLVHGADPNARDCNLSSTPLHGASSQGWLEVARLLFSHGASVDEKDEEGRTSLQVAASEGHVEMTKLLLDHGAQPEPGHVCVGTVRLVFSYSQYSYVEI